MTVDFQSFGCSESGHWNTGDCVTTNFGADTFTIPAIEPITASIYDPRLHLTTPIATSTITRCNPVTGRRRTRRELHERRDDDVGQQWFDPISGGVQQVLRALRTAPVAVASTPRAVAEVNHAVAEAAFVQ